MSAADTARAADSAVSAMAGAVSAGGPDRLVLLVWASWADASRPSVTTARELGRRHAPRVAVEIVDIGEESVRVGAALGTLLRSRETEGDPQAAVPHDGGDGVSMGAVLDPGALLESLGIEVVPTWIACVRDDDPHGDGPTWRECGRLRGARPKHEVEAALFVG